MLDRYLLRYFLAVVDQGNFTRAAAHCHVTQPTLSVGIARLEQMIGQPLFIRSSQRVALTTAGSRFLPHARRIEREFNLALQSLDVAAGQPPLRLGMLVSVPAGLIAASIAASRPTDHYRFELLFGNERDLAGHLARGRIDVALTLVGRSGSRFVEQPLLTEGYALALAADHRLADQAEIAADQLASEPMIVRRHCEALAQTSRFFTDRGVRPHFTLRSTSDEQVLLMVAAGLGLTLMPVSHMADGVVRPRLAGFAQTRTLGFAVAAGSEALLADPPALLTEISRRLQALS